MLSLGKRLRLVSGKGFHLRLDRPIHQLTCIPKAKGTVTYDTVDTAIQLTLKAGPRAILAKTDVEHAYKLVTIHLENIPALGIRWLQHWLWDATLLMGSRSGCAIFETFSDALQYLAQWKGCGDMCHVLDDFLMVSQTDETADSRRNTFLGLCGQTKQNKETA